MLVLPLVVGLTSILGSTRASVWDSSNCNIQVGGRAICREVGGASCSIGLIDAPPPGRLGGGASGRLGGGESGRLGGGAWGASGRLRREASGRLGEGAYGRLGGEASGRLGLGEHLAG